MLTLMTAPSSSRPPASLRASRASRSSEKLTKPNPLERPSSLSHTSCRGGGARVGRERGKGWGEGGRLGGRRRRADWRRHPAAAAAEASRVADTHLDGAHWAVGLEPLAYCALVGVCRGRHGAGVLQSRPCACLRGAGGGTAPRHCRLPPAQPIAQLAACPLLAVAHHTASGPRRLCWRCFAPQGGHFRRHGVGSLPPPSCCPRRICRPS